MHSHVTVPYVSPCDWSRFCAHDDRQVRHIHPSRRDPGVLFRKDSPIHPSPSYMAYGGSSKPKPQQKSVPQITIACVIRLLDIDQELKIAAASWERQEAAKHR